MLNFRKATIEDKDEIDRLLFAGECPSLEYNFTTIFLWQDIYNTEFAIEDKVLFLRFGDNKKTYLFPCGFGDVDKAVDKIVDIGGEFSSLSLLQTEYLEKKFPGMFTFLEYRDMEDYVYSAKSLRTLAGKKLSSKRNHINRFVAENPDWSYEEISKENIDEVRRMHTQWVINADIEGRDGLAEETVVVRKAFDNFDKLRLTGGLIRANGKVIAFSIGDKLNKNTFLVHIEKAMGNIQGAYQIINREFVINNCDGFEFVNREEDTGDEGLRKAKLSYRPVRLIEKYGAKRK